jgi:hypothetical protein
VDLRGIFHEDLKWIHMTLNRNRKVMKSVDVDVKILIGLFRDEVKSFGAEWSRGISRSKFGVLRFLTSFILLSVIAK